MMLTLNFMLIFSCSNNKQFSPFVGENKKDEDIYARHLYGQHCVRHRCIEKASASMPKSIIEDSFIESFEGVAIGGQFVETLVEFGSLGASG